jgi:hypothetical protein
MGGTRLSFSQVAVHFSPRFMRVVTASGRTVRVWEARSGALVSTFRGVAATAISAVLLDKTERNVIVGEHSGAVSLISLATGGKVRHAILCASDL